MIVVVCDVCDQLAPGIWTMYSANGRTFVVCGVCEDKPFRVPPAKACMVVVGNVVHQLNETRICP